MNNLNIILKDDATTVENLLPLTFTRPVSNLLVGSSTIAEKWQKLLDSPISYATTDYLSELFPTVASDDNIIIFSHYLPTTALRDEILPLAPGEALTDADNSIIAFRGSAEVINNSLPFASLSLRPTVNSHKKIEHIYDLFLLCDELLRNDFSTITADRQSQPLPESCILIGDSSQLFIEEGASVEGAIINVRQGPVYIGRNAEIMEGACLRGPISIGHHSTVKMGAKIYGATTIGCHCKVGGELNNVVMHDFSNKAHDGFLGNAVIGSWCNLGAGCTASNLKNDYTEIKLWNYRSCRFLRTGLLHCGLIMGDHSKAGVNTMFNTATVIGVGVNIHGTGFPRNFVASFSEGSTAGFNEVQLSKFLSTAKKVMARRNVELTDADIRMFEALHQATDSYR